jgi:uncharacterized protein (DUF305 family)
MRLITLLGVLLCLNLLVARAYAAEMNMHDGPPVPSQYGKTFQNFASEMNVGMAKMMTDMHAPGYTGDPDIDFLEMMIPHHEGAVDMARLVLQHGTDPVTRKLAEEIIGSQRVEIEGMSRRLQDLRKGASRSDPGGYPALGGTRGAQQPAQQ